jgi:hypothetical protein
VILVHGNRNLRIQFRCCLNQPKEIEILGKGAGSAAGLHDHRRLGLLGGHHDGLNLFHVVHVECADAVTAFGGLVEELPHGD